MGRTHKMRRAKIASPALALFEPAALVERAPERPLPAHLLQGVAEYVAAAHADNTKRAYTQAWQRFLAWCEDYARTALPAGPEIVAVWIVALATGAGGRKPLARATINLYLSAIAEAHRTARHPFDRGAPGDRRELAGDEQDQGQARCAAQGCPIDGRAAPQAGDRPGPGSHHRCTRRGIVDAGLVCRASPLGARRARLAEAGRRPRLR